MLWIGAAVAATITGGDVTGEFSKEVYGRQARRFQTWCHTRVHLDTLGQVVQQRSLACFDPFVEITEDVVRRSTYTPVRVDGVATEAFVDISVRWQGGHSRVSSRGVAHIVDEVEYTPPVELLEQHTMPKTLIDRGSFRCTPDVRFTPMGDAVVASPQDCPESVQPLVDEVLTRSRWGVVGDVAEPARIQVTFNIHLQPELEILPPRADMWDGGGDDVPLLRSAPAGAGVRPRVMALKGDCVVTVDIGADGVPTAVSPNDCSYELEGSALRRARLIRWYPLEEPQTVPFTIQFQFHGDAGLLGRLLRPPNEDDPIEPIR